MGQAASTNGPGVRCDDAGTPLVVRTLHSEPAPAAETLLSVDNMPPYTAWRREDGSSTGAGRGVCYAESAFPLPRMRQHLDCIQEAVTRLLLAEALRVRLSAQLEHSSGAMSPAAHLYGASGAAAYSHQAHGIATLSPTNLTGGALRGSSSVRPAGTDAHAHGSYLWQAPANHYQATSTRPQTHQSSRKAASGRTGSPHREYCGLTSCDMYAVHMR